MIEDIKQFLMDNPNIRFDEGEITNALNRHPSSVIKALRKIIRKDAHYDSRFKKDFVRKLVKIEKSSKRKEYIMGFTTSVYWFKQ